MKLESVACNKYMVYNKDLQALVSTLVERKIMGNYFDRIVTIKFYK